MASNTSSIYGALQTAALSFYLQQQQQQAANPAMLDHSFLNEFISRTLGLAQQTSLVAAPDNQTPPPPPPPAKTSTYNYRQPTLNPLALDLLKQFIPASSYEGQQLDARVSSKDAKSLGQQHRQNKVNSPASSVSSAYSERLNTSPEEAAAVKPASSSSRVDSSPSKGVKRPLLKFSMDSILATTPGVDLKSLTESQKQQLSSSLSSASTCSSSSNGDYSFSSSCSTPSKRICLGKQPSWSTTPCFRVNFYSNFTYKLQQDKTLMSQKLTTAPDADHRVKMNYGNGGNFGEMTSAGSMMVNKGPLTSSSYLAEVNSLMCSADHHHHHSSSRLSAANSLKHSPFQNNNALTTTTNSNNNNSPQTSLYPLGMGKY